MTRSNASRVRDASASRGMVGRRARWWLWGVLPYLWLALFSEALHTHAPLSFPASVAVGASTWERAQAAVGSDAAADSQARSAPSAANRAQELADCLACQWLACSAALLCSAFVLLGHQLASAGLTRVPRLVDATPRCACSRGPPSSLMFAV